MTTRLASTEPLTPERFKDLEVLFAGKGCSFARGCWCMGYRIRGEPTPPAGVSRADYKKKLLRNLAKADPTPGLIGYDTSGEPVGWISFGPRETFARLQHSSVMKPVDDRPVWSIVCFVVPAPNRRQGIAKALLRDAISYARKKGARTIEAYPIDKPGRSQDQWLWHGVKSMFDSAGFREIARRKPQRPVMRLELQPNRTTKASRKSDKA